MHLIHPALTTYPWEYQPDQIEQPTELEHYAERFEVNPNEYRVGITRDELADHLAAEWWDILVTEYTTIVLDPEREAMMQLSHAADVLIDWIHDIHREQGS